MDPLEEFYAEQAERMNIPDEDSGSYVARISSGPRTRSTWDFVTPSPSPSERSASSEPSLQESTRKTRPISNASVSDNNAQLGKVHAGGSFSNSKTGSDTNVLVAHSSASGKRKIAEREPDVRADKRRKSDDCDTEDSRMLDTLQDPIGLDGAVRSQRNVSDHALRMSPQDKFDDSCPSLTRHGDPSRPVISSVNVAAAIAASEDHESGAEIQRPREKASDPSRTRHTPATSSRRGAASIGRPAARKSDDLEVWADASNVTTPSNTAGPSTKAPVVAPSGKVAPKKPATATTAIKKSASKKKEKVRLIPSEYAKKITQAMAERAMDPNRPPLKGQDLKGLRIFFASADHTTASEGTMKKMDILVKRGATLLPTYDPELVTHIITTASARTTLEQLGLKSLREIPVHIPTLGWSWVIARYKGGIVRTHDHAVFPDRIHFETDDGFELQLGSKRGKSTLIKLTKDGKPLSNDSGEFSKISDFTQDKATTSRIEPASHVAGRAPSSPIDFSIGEPASKRRLEEDPLADFYEQARAEAEAERMRGWAEYDSDTDGEGCQRTSSSATLKGGRHQPPAQKKKAVFACDKKMEQPSDRICPNQDVIDKLGELKGLHEVKPGEGDKWRSLSYRRAINSLRSYPKRIKSVEEAQKLPGVAEATALKIMEIIETGDLQRIKYTNTEDVKVVKLFMGIYGAGPQVATKWYANGCRTLEDLKNGKGGVRLSSVQRIGVKYYDDINDRMPRQEAREIFEKIKPLALEIDPRLFVEIMGSYRRGKADCGDIDILITRPTDDGKTHVGVLKKLLMKCHERGIVTEDLNLPNDWSDLENIYRGLCRRDENSRRRRLDFLTVPYESRGAALLYYTGDDIANKMGFSLNQRGLFANVVRNESNRREKLDDGVVIASATEEEIFEKLDPGPDDSGGAVSEILLSDNGMGGWTGSLNQGGFLSVLVGNAGGPQQSFQLGVSDTGPIHSGDIGSPLLGDTTSNQALLFSPAFAPPPKIDPTYPNYTLPAANLTFPAAPSDPPSFQLFIAPTDAFASAGIPMTGCAVTEAASTAGNGMLLVTPQQSEGLWLRDDDGWRWQWVVQGLTPSTNYTAFAVQDGTKVSDEIMFVTKSAAFSCPLVHSLPYCPRTAYAMPLSPPPSPKVAHDASTLPSSLTDPLLSYFTNFTVSLLTHPCGRDMYSPLVSCADCQEAYRKWLCAVSLPRCSEPRPGDPIQGAPPSKRKRQQSSLTSLAGSLHIFGSDDDPQVPLSALSPQPTSQPPRNANLPAFTSNYDELLPCLETCTEVDRACPIMLGFKCPVKKFTASQSYGVGFVDTGEEGEQGGGITGALQDRYGNVWCNEG
ncbi:stretch-activated cation channel mid1 [Steccherinum ochraceum]|uniref:DNA-directed DNA polymerase n=1 Tax=Steccherinum ochraceum TaxID=92696 RepID=A0A4R0RB45_9APHY|nr:stretch-activated cation channel mid1 [Steccherinum ochraceum]